MSELAQWERLWDLGETDKAWAAFEIYKGLPLHHKDPTKRRTLANTAKIIGHRSTTSVEDWSSKYNWVARARAFDTHLSKLSLTVREKNLADYQQHVYVTEGTEISLLERTLHTKIKQTLDQIETPDIVQVDEKTGEYIEVEPIDLLRLVNATEKLQGMRRRLGQLPTNYKTDTAEPEAEDGVYVITSD